MIHLVTGATGNIGGRVVDRLLQRGERPRVFARSAEKARARFGDRVDVVVGDLADAAALAAALDGATTLFLASAGPDLARHDEAAVEAAGRTGRPRVVKLSSNDVLRSDESSVAAWHARGEEAIRASGLAWTFLRPVGFMSNALAWAASIKAARVVRASTGDGKVAMIHPDDIADVAVAALTTPRHEGEALAITGPTALAYREMTAIIGAAIGEPLGFEPISDEEALKGLIGRGMPPAHASALVGLWRAIREGWAATVTDTVERVLGRKPRTFDQWARENAAAFRSV